MRQFRVTVEDLETGERRVKEIAAGDFLLVPFAPCHLANVQRYPKAGTVVLTVKDHRPQDAPVDVAPHPVAESLGVPTGDPA